MIPKKIINNIRISKEPEIYLRRTWNIDKAIITWRILYRLAKNLNKQLAVIEQRYNPHFTNKVGYKEFKQTFWIGYYSNGKVITSTSRTDLITKILASHSIVIKE